MTTWLTLNKYSPEQERQIRREIICAELEALSLDAERDAIHSGDAPEVRLTKEAHIQERLVKRQNLLAELQNL